MDFAGCISYDYVQLELDAPAYPVPTVRDTRKANLLLVVKRAGSRAELARAIAAYKGNSAVETYQSYISQILGKNARRAVGDDFARDLERAVNLPEGWVDVPHSEKAAEVVPLHDALSDTGVHLARTFEKFGPDARDLAVNLFDEIAKRLPAKPRQKRKKR